MTKEQIDRKKSKKRYYLRNPWAKTLYRIKNRKNGKRQRYRDLEVSITVQELKYLWFRDKAYLMKQSSIDRIDNDKGYYLKNCRYLELKENHIRSIYKPIKQVTLNGKFIKRWDSVGDAQKALNIICLSNALVGRYKQSGGYKWKYANKRNKI